MDAGLNPCSGAVSIGRALGQQLGRERARGLALAGPAGAVEQVRVRGAALVDGRGEDRERVRVTLAAWRALAAIVAPGNVEATATWRAES